MAVTTFSVKSNIDDLLDDIRELSEAVKDKATVRTLNELGAQVRTETSKQIRAAGYGMKAATIKRSLKLRKANSGNMTAVLVCSGKPIPMIEYGARQTSRGVSVKVKGKREILRHAFLQTVGAGHIGVFQRKTNPRLQAGARGRQILNRQMKELFGPSVPAAMANEAITQALEALVDSKFESVFLRNVAFYRKR